MAPRRHLQINSLRIAASYSCIWYIWRSRISVRCWRRFFYRSTKVIWLIVWDPVLFKICQTYEHSVESPSMTYMVLRVQANLHKVCWGAVGCEWGTTSVYFGITYVCFIPSRLPVFAVEPHYRHQDISYFCQKYHLKDAYKIFKKFHVGLKF